MPLLFFYKDGYSIKYSITVEMPLNKEIKPNKFRIQLEANNSYWTYEALKTSVQKIFPRGSVAVACAWMSYPLKNNGQLYFECEAKGKKKNALHIREKKESKCNKEETGRSDKDIHQMLNVCFNGIVKRKKWWKIGRDSRRNE